jgi:hypothetical protein
MKEARLFTFVYKVAEKPDRWVDELTVVVEATDPDLGIDQIQNRVTNYMQTGDNLAVLRELRGDISFDWRSQGPETLPNSYPVFDEDGLRIFTPFRGVKTNDGM